MLTHRHLFRVMKDNIRPNTFRVVHLAPVDPNFIDSDVPTLVEGDDVYATAWVRSSIGEVAEFDTNQAALRAIADLCHEVDLSTFTQEGGDVPVHKTGRGFKAL